MFDHFLPWLNGIHNKSFTTEERVLGLNTSSKNNNAMSLRNYLTFFIRHVIHVNRFKVIQGSPTVRKNIIIKKIKKAIERDLHYNYNIARTRGQQSINIFKNKFLINNTLGSIDQTNNLVTKF